MNLGTTTIHQLNCAFSLERGVYLSLSQLKVNSLFLQVDVLRLSTVAALLMDTLITVEAD